MDTTADYTPLWTPQGSSYMYGDSITDTQVWETFYDPKPEHDAVNHPKHYTAHPSGVECIEITQHYNFCIGNAIKYLWRNGLKDSAPQVQDLEKAIWYIQREINNLKTGVYE